MTPARDMASAPQDGTPIVVSVGRYYGVPETGHYQFERVSFRKIPDGFDGWHPIDDDRMTYGAGSFVGWWPDGTPEAECEQRPRTNFKWVPSNGTEGEIFQDEWCARCQRDAAFRAAPDSGQGCEILASTMWTTGIGDPDYPDEWTNRDGEPKCTAFELDLGDNAPPRCDQTADLFGGAS